MRTSTWVARLPRIAGTDGAAFRARLATSATLALPLALLVGRAWGEAAATAIAFIFLADRTILHSWAWVRAPWATAALMFWAWVLFCSALAMDPDAILQAILLVRFFLLIAALETWALESEQMRRWLHWVVLAAALWVLVECWQQYLMGTNLFGVPRAGDGSLTGPFDRPRAGPVYLEVFFPAFLPIVLALTEKPGWARWLAAMAVLAFTTATMVLIGQRMPSVLLLLGLCCVGVLYRRFRLAVLLTLLAAAGLLALTPVVSPPTFAKLVVKFSQQMEHFWATPYGMLFERSVAMIQAHPWFGLGWDGFKRHCMSPEYLTGVSWLPVSDPANVEGCSVHPHNYWTQVATTAGLPGLVLFGVLVGLWIQRMGGGSAFRRNRRRGALLVFVIVAMWPIASTTSLYTFPNAGWTFLMIGWGLAEARASTGALANRSPWPGGAA